MADPSGPGRNARGWRVRGRALPERAAQSEQVPHPLGRPTLGASQRRCSVNSRRLSRARTGRRFVCLGDPRQAEVGQQQCVAAVLQRLTLGVVGDARHSLGLRAWCRRGASPPRAGRDCACSDRTSNRCAGGLGSRRRLLSHLAVLSRMDASRGPTQVHRLGIPCPCRSTGAKDDRRGCLDRARLRRRRRCGGRTWNNRPPRQPVGVDVRSGEFPLHVSIERGAPSALLICLEQARQAFTLRCARKMHDPRMGR